MFLAAAAGIPQTEDMTATNGQQATDGTQKADWGKWLNLPGKDHDDARNGNLRFSICGDPDADTLTEETTDTVKADEQGIGVEGILEGFGLLSFKMEGSCQGDNTGQAVNDVPTTKPPLENVARKQTSLPQGNLCAGPIIYNIQSTSDEGTPEMQSANVPNASTLPMAGVQNPLGLAVPSDGQVENVMAEADALQMAESPGGQPVTDAPNAAAENGDSPRTSMSLELPYKDAAAEAEATQDTTGPAGKAASAMFERLHGALVDVAETDMPPVRVEKNDVEPATPTGERQTTTDNPLGIPVESFKVKAPKEGSGIGQNDDLSSKAQSEKTDQPMSTREVQAITAFGTDAMQSPQSANTAEKQNLQLKSEQAQIAVKPNAADMAQNTMKIVQSIQSQAKDGKYELSVMLKPESLGKVSIKLVMDDNGLKATIKAESSAAKDAIAGQITSLDGTLKEKGIPVHRIEVTYEAPSFDAQQYEGKNQHQSAPRNGVRALASQDTETADNAYIRCESDLAIRNSSIEFRA